MSLFTEKAYQAAKQVERMRMNLFLLRLCQSAKRSLPQGSPLLIFYTSDIKRHRTEVRSAIRYLRSYTKGLSTKDVMNTREFQGLDWLLTQAKI